MAHPFEPMTTEKLKSYFQKRLDANCKGKDTNQCLEKVTGNKLKSISRRIMTKRQREINS